MSVAAAQPESSPRQRWPLWAAAILAGQIGFIFWLGARHPISARIPNTTPPTTLAVDYDLENAALNDPTLFALPHWQGFSGTAWKQTPQVGYIAAGWSEPMRWLPLSTEKLGNCFHQLVADNPAPTLTLTEKTAPQIAALEFSTDFFPLPTQSSLQLTAGLTRRTLLTPLDLPSWPVADVLDKSEVRVLVDASGQVVSAALVSDCGLPAADQLAVERARAMRFAPLPDGAQKRLAQPLADLCAGNMIFHWHSIAPKKETSSRKP